MGEMNKRRKKVIMPQGLSAQRSAPLCAPYLCSEFCRAQASKALSGDL